MSAQGARSSRSIPRQCGVVGEAFMPLTDGTVSHGWPRLRSQGRAPPIRRASSRRRRARPIDAPPWPLHRCLLPGLQDRSRPAGTRLPLPRSHRASDHSAPALRSMNDQLPPKPYQCVNCQKNHEKPHRSCPECGKAGTVVVRDDLEEAPHDAEPATDEGSYRCIDCGNITERPYKECPRCGGRAIAPRGRRVPPSQQFTEMLMRW